MARNPVTSALDAAERAATIYRNYALKALGGGVPPTFTGAEVSLLRVALFQAWSSRPATASTVAAAWLQGLMTFWFIPPVVFGSGAVVSSAPPIALVAPCLKKVADPVDTPEAATLAVAACLHAATLSVQVLIPPATTPVNLV